MLPYHNLTNTEFHSFITQYNYNVNNFMENDLLSSIEKSIPACIYNNIHCKYYNENSFNQCVKNINPKLSMLHFNIRSLNKNRLQFQTLLACLNLKFHVIGLSELGKNNIDSNAAYFKNYTLYHDVDSAHVLLLLSCYNYHQLIGKCLCF